MTRHGFTLTELLIGMVVLALLGTALARILINNSRFVSRQDAMMDARATARAAMQPMVVELHMVPDSGLVMAARDSISVTVPYAFGMTCQPTSGTATVAALMPVDSLIYASAVTEGMAWRDSTGRYQRQITGISVASSTNLAQCTNDSVRVIPGGQLIAISGIPSARMPPSGSIFYLFQTVAYRFMTSVDVPGRRGLWRRAGTGAYEELAAPFDTAAKFAFLMGPFMQTQLRSSLPSRASRDSVRGIELRLTGQSVSAPQGTSSPQTFDLRTSVAFMNKVY
ncbi:MAG: type II secretion system protein [Gemmatimonadetes bacterium]|nr:type II secretion system protein [Gemmatimonadota bacterium]